MFQLDLQVNLNQILTDSCFVIIKNNVFLQTLIEINKHNRPVENDRKIAEPRHFREQANFFANTTRNMSNITMRNPTKINLGEIC